MAYRAEDCLITVLSADEDEDDRLLIEEALLAAELSTRLRFVADGQELIDYLRRDDTGLGADDSPRPSLILLDLNMPQKDGCEALREIKADPTLRQIPVIVLTSSRTQTDIDRAYDLGANSFIAKPLRARRSSTRCRRR